MDFSVIRRKKKTPPPPPEPQAPPPDPNPPAQPPPPGENLPPPHHPYLPYMEELDRAARFHYLRSVEYSNARSWRFNFGDQYPEQHYNRFDYSHTPIVGYRGRNYDYDYPNQHAPPRIALPPPDYHHCLPVPPPDYGHYLPGPPPRLGLPPPGPPQPHSSYFPPPRYVNYFSDENPNGCGIM
ncbi:hypothetical protein ACS0TY_006619 [Phlomoides rotata]